MFTWIANNLGTLIVCLALTVIVAVITAHIIRDRKQGKSSCGCGCSNCAMACSCHGLNKE